ncbi:MAG: FAD-binding oxidoreductase [Novosphingobium sp.]
MAITLPEPVMTVDGPLRVTKIGDGGALPAEVDIAIIGGGLNGVMTAYWLARAGVRTVVLEKGEIAGEASGRAFGWVSNLLLDPVKMELCAQSKALWARLQEEVGELGYRRHGLVFLASDREEAGFFESWIHSVGDPALADANMLTQQEVSARFPGFQGRTVGGIFSPGDGSAEPRIAAVAVARTARKLGAAIHSRCAVRGLDIAGGRVCGVITEHGRIRAGNVLFAGNTWSRLFCGNHGINVPQLYVLTSMGRTGVVPDGPVGAGGSHEWAWRRQPDGAYSIGRLVGQKAPLTRDSIRLFRNFIPALRAEGRNICLSLNADCRRDWFRPRRWRMDEVTPFERERIIRPLVDETVAETAFRELCAAFPAFRSTRIVEHWAGPITITPDNMPIASPVEGLPGFHLLTGCSYGMTWSPALGRMMAAIMTGQKPELDPRPFRFSRFFDGSSLRVAQ